jgi:thiamine biosynthesis protein ThiI
MGGLPVGSSGKLVCFVSGGIDSPVAGYKMFRRGCTVIFVHFHNHHEGEQDVKDKVQSLVQTLSRYQPFTKLYLVPFGELQRALIGYVPSEMRMVSYRRMMFRIGSHIRRKESAKGYVTGDAVGQVASQTMDNLRAIHAVADYPVLSPLIGDSKQEIISVARQIDTYDLSILPYADCCSFLVDKHPDTSIDLDELNEIEEPIPVDELIRPCLEQTELYRFQFGKLLEVKPAFKDSFLESLS